MTETGAENGIRGIVCLENIPAVYDAQFINQCHMVMSHILYIIIYKNCFPVGCAFCSQTATMQRFKTISFARIFRQLPKHRFSDSPFRPSRTISKMHGGKNSMDRSECECASSVERQIVVHRFIVYVYICQHE